MIKDCSTVPFLPQCNINTWHLAIQAIFPLENSLNTPTICKFDHLTFLQVLGQHLLCFPHASFDLRTSSNLVRPPFPVSTLMIMKSSSASSNIVILVNHADLALSFLHLFFLKFRNISLLSQSILDPPVPSISSNLAFYKRSYLVKYHWWGEVSLKKSANLGEIPKGWGW